MNTENKVCFIRIPKNASSSMYEQCGHVNLLRDADLVSLFKKRRFRNYFNPSHAFLSESVETLGTKILNYPVFCIVRNPFDRMVSTYKYCKRITETKAPVEQVLQHYVKKCDSFQTFVKYCFDNRKNKDEIASIKQTDYLDVDHDITKLRFENLQEDFEKFIIDNNIFGIARKLVKLNSTEGLPYREYYSKTTIDMVTEMWSEDFEKFGYSKKL